MMLYWTYFISTTPWRLKVQDKPRRALKFMDGRVITVNVFGEAIRQFCGPYSEVHQAVVAASNDRTVFQHQIMGEHALSMRDVKKEEW